uniref:Cell wall hydrolase/autolysin n=1 Tax=uncultured marine virus TaxID=186617 RepID=A0A0F7L9X9_9VIRU|nr:cell wall hydrolase/autolysin [uncultured marine virus]
MEHLPFSFVCAEEWFKDNTRCFEHPEEPCASLVILFDGLSSPVGVIGKGGVHGFDKGFGGLFAVLGGVPVKGFVSVGLGIAKGVEVEFDHKQSIKGINAKLKVSHSFGVGVPVVFVDNGNINVFVKVKIDKVGKGSIVGPLSVGFVPAHGSLVVGPRMPYSQHKALFPRLTYRSLQDPLRIHPKATIAVFLKHSYNIVNSLYIHDVYVLLLLLWDL